MCLVMTNYPIVGVAIFFILGSPSHISGMGVARHFKFGVRTDTDK